MAKESYSIPISPSECYDVSNTVLRMLIKFGAQWKVPAPVITDFQTLMDGYNSTYQVASNRSTQSPGATAARKAAWSNTKPLLVEIYNSYLVNNPDISVSDKEAMGIFVINQGGKTPYPAPTTIPNITLSSEQISLLYVLFNDSATPSSHAKPEGVAFCELRYKIDGASPTSPEECSQSAYVSRSHEAIVFEPSQRGKVVYGYARWINRNSKTGPWGGLVTTVIP